jgi:hypothetical protein
VFYISTEGFMQLRGGEVTRIGEGLLDRHLWRAINQSRLQDVTVGVDPFNKIVAWGIPNDASGYARRMYCYKIDDGRWSVWFSDIEALATIRRGQASEKFCAFNTSHKLCTFTGSAKQATFETKALQPVSGRRWQCNGIRVIMNNGQGVGATQTGTVTVMVSDNPHPASTPATFTAVSLHPDNYFPIRTAGRYQSFEIKLTASASNDALQTHYLGIELDYEVLGER